MKEYNNHLKNRITFFKEKLKKLMEEFNENNSIKLIGGNKDNLLNIKTKKKLLLIIIVPLVLIGVPILGILIYNFITNGMDQVVVYLIGAIIFFAAIILIEVFYDRRYRKYIGTIILKNDILEIRLLDKHHQTQLDAVPIIYKLNEIEIKYKIISREPDSSMPSQNYYIYIKHNNKTIKYNILLSYHQEDDFKTFVAFIGFLIKKIDIDKLEIDEISKLLKDSWK